MTEEEWNKLPPEEQEKILAEIESQEALDADPEAKLEKHVEDVLKKKIDELTADFDRKQADMEAAYQTKVREADADYHKKTRMIAEELDALNPEAAQKYRESKGILRDLKPDAKGFLTSQFKPQTLITQADYNDMVARRLTPAQITAENKRRNEQVFGQIKAVEDAMLASPIFQSLMNLSHAASAAMKKEDNQKLWTAVMLDELPGKTPGEKLKDPRVPQIVEMLDNEGWTDLAETLAPAQRAAHIKRVLAQLGPATRLAQPQTPAPGFKRPPANVLAMRQTTGPRRKPPSTLGSRGGSPSRPSPDKQPSIVDSIARGQ
jgi:hypothetical protein